MSKLKIYTCQFRYGGEDRFDITVKSGNDIFAPTWQMVMEHKNGTLANESYIKMYKDLMNNSYKQNKSQWKALLDCERVTFVCYCGSFCFCHRVLLAEMLVKAFGCEYVGEVDSKGNIKNKDDIVVKKPKAKAKPKAKKVYYIIDEVATEVKEPTSKSSDGSICERCLGNGIEVEMFVSEHLDRCPNCMESSLAEMSGEEHFKLISKGKLIDGRQQEY